MIGKQSRTLPVSSVHVMAVERLRRGIQVREQIEKSDSGAGWYLLSIMCSGMDLEEKYETLK